MVDFKPSLLPSLKERRQGAFLKQQRNRWLFIIANIAGGLLLGVALWLALPRVPWLATALLVALVAALITVAMLGYRVYQTQVNLRRRLKELSTLNQISQVLRSTLELDNLLAILQLQVRQFLGVDNFYIALYDQIEERLWYPIAVKNGQNVFWPPRKLTDRLTDRVIHDRQPILLENHAQEHLSRIGLPVGEDAPYAWMGVPLIASERVIGCLAVFTYQENVEFTNSDLILLETLSGQVSVAIENALLKKKAQQSASQLETMNKILSLSNSSINLQDILEKICLSVTDVAGAAHSAIFIVNEDYNEIILVQSSRLSEAFSRLFQRTSMVQDERTRCLRTGQPNLIPDLVASSLGTNFVTALIREGVRACGDFPLITPEGQVGFLSVYYDTAHPFSNEEIELLQTFAAQAALVVSNVRLHAQSDMALARRANQLTILETIGRQLAAAIHSNRLFEIILDFAMEFTHSSWGNIAILDPARQILEFKAWRGYAVNLPNLPLSKGICGKAALTRQPINSPDVAADPNYLDFTEGKARSQLSIPLLHEGQVLGVLTLENSLPNSYSVNDQSFIAQLANQAAVALVNAMLYNDVASGRERLSAVINSTREGILMVDNGGIINLANSSFLQLAQLTMDELIGKWLPELPSPAFQVLGFDRTTALEIVEALRQGREPDLAPQLVHPDEASRIKALERFSSLVRSANSEITGWMVVLRDVTEEQALAQTRQFITETLVHDLRSPMSAVLGALDVIQEYTRGTGDNQLYRAVEIADHGAQRALRLVEAMLDIAQLEMDKEKLNLEPVDLTALAVEVIGEFTSQCNSYGLTLHTNLADGCSPVQADPLKVSRILANLLDNAVKYTPKGGEIGLSTSSVGDEVHVSVFDTGPGIPPEYREKIFQRFSQVPGQIGRRRGSGLGLAFCKLAVEAQGGRIWVENTENGGSRFVFTLRKI
ncbi:MAG: GAF domain-containing protein [Chloroflexi bacterium]|nr:GAF domain-containing protein [Chloroflexota bacterium]